MPQSHNPDLLQERGGAFGKNSRFMSTVDFSWKCSKTVKVQNALEDRIRKIKLRVIERNAGHFEMIQRRARERVFDSLKERQAYKYVAKARSFKRNPDYQKALNADYTLRGFKNDIKKVVVDMHPDTIRMKRAKAEVDNSYRKLDRSLKKTLDGVDKINPPKLSFERLAVVRYCDYETLEDVNRKINSEHILYKPIPVLKPVTLPPIGPPKRQHTIIAKRMAVTKAFVKENTRTSLLSNCNGSRPESTSVGE